MPVVTNAVWQVTPGRGPEVIAAMARARAIHERMGARATAVQAVYAGPNANRINYLLWFSDMAAFGAFNDALPANSDWQKLVAEVIAVANPAATLVSNSMGADFPGFDTALPEPVAPGSVLWTTNWQLRPGRMADIAAALTEWRAIAARHGLKTRTVTLDAAGPATGAITVATVFANMADYARVAEALLADPACQSVWERALGPDSPTALLGQTLGRYLPI